MKRLAGLIVVAFLLLVAPVAAQDSTPTAPESFELAPGVIADGLVFVEGQDNPSLYRLHFDAGVSYPIEPSHSLELIYIEAGSLKARLDASVTIASVEASGATGETVTADTEFTVSAGQYFVLAPGVSGEVRNDGADTATVSVAGIVPSVPETPAATPADS